jgi:hypothetical protein
MVQSKFYRNDKIPGRRGYGIDDVELFGSGVPAKEISMQFSISKDMVWHVVQQDNKCRTQAQAA